MENKEQTQSEFFAVPNNSAARAAIQLANSKGKEMREVITLAEAALPSDTQGAQAQEKK